jgi:glycosyltransferase involved in cell wall biosynthesis
VPVATRVSIVTPSLNHAPFIEQTIRSVLEQDYPAIDYLIFDGGSTDGSQEIIASFGDRLAHWQSGPDGGQSRAINLGWQRTKGDVIAWLNADDYYTPGAVSRAVAALEADPKATLVYSDCRFLDQATGTFSDVRVGERDLETLLTQGMIPQPTMFLRREVVDQTGLLDEGFRYWMDYELALRAATRGRMIYLEGEPLAVFRRHPASKSAGYPLAFAHEFERLMERAATLAPSTAVGTARARFYFTCAKAELVRGNPFKGLGWWLRGVRAQPSLAPRAHVEKLRRLVRFAA